MSLKGLHTLWYLSICKKYVFIILGDFFPHKNAFAFSKHFLVTLEWIRVIFQVAIAMMKRKKALLMKSSGWPDEFVKKIAQSVAKPIFWTKLHT
jgi:hypothetical protein